VAYFLRLPRGRRSGRMRRESDQSVFVHSAPLVAHDRCVPAGYENHSRELEAQRERLKAQVRADHASRGEVNPSTGEGWEYPSAGTPDELVRRLNENGRALNAWRDPISTLAGAGWDWCWAPIYSDRPDAPDCHWCGDPVVGRG
jgi:hypothetical protein